MFNIAYIANSFLKVKSDNKYSILHNAVNSSGNGVVLDVRGFNQCSFLCNSIGGSFNAQVYFEGSLNNISWQPLLVFDENNNPVEYYNCRKNVYKIFCADVSRFNYLRARVLFNSGTNITIEASANLATFNPVALKNKLLLTHTDTYINNVSRAFFGDWLRSSTVPGDILPVNFASYRKKSILIQNDIDVDIIVEKIFVNMSPEETVDNRALELDVNINVPALSKKIISSSIYPELEKVFGGLGLFIYKPGTGTTGSITLKYYGGN